MFSRSTITQRVQTNYGTVIGEYHAAPGAKPPSVESIIAYLDHVHARTQIRRKELKSDVMRLYHGGARQQVLAVYLLGWVGHRRVATGIGYQPGRTLDI